MAKVLIYSANLGGFDNSSDHVEQVLPEGIESIKYHRFTDDDYPPRASMSPRLQARIIKMFGWQFEPDFDYYLWVDSSCKLAKENSLKWFMEQLGEADMAVFKHPHRDTIQQEADYLKHRLEINCPYITPRYKNEDIDGQLKEVDPQQELYASTAFIFRNNSKTRHAMKDWWYHTSRYHSIDQLSLPFVLFENNVKVSVIPDNYLKCEYLEYVRKSGHRSV